MLGLLGIISRWIKYIGFVIIIAICGTLMLYSFIKVNPNEINAASKFFATIANYENQFFDFRYNQYLKSKPPSMSPHAVLAEIDDKSINLIGRFPWTRTVWVDLIKKLDTYGAKVIAFDVVFSEPENACVGSPDKSLAVAISNFSNGPGNIIIGYSKTPVHTDSLDEFPFLLYNYVLSGSAKISDPLIEYPTKTTFPIEILQDVEVGTGYIDISHEDLDGVFRSYTSMANLHVHSEIKELEAEGEKPDPQFFPSFGLLTYKQLSGDQFKYSLSVKGGSGSISLDLKNGSIELDPTYSNQLRFRGTFNAFETASIYDILKADNNDEQMKQLFQDKAVFIGSTAFAAHDFRNSPVDAKMPGVFFHMNYLDMLMDGRFYQPSDKTLIYSVLILVLTSLIIVGIQALNSAVIDLVVTILLLVITYYIDTKIFLPHGYQLKLFFIFNNIIFLYFWDTALNFYIAVKEKRQIRGAFSRYVAPSIVNEMLDNPEKLKMGGEKKDITVFFSDVRDFTSISEKLSPTELATCINQYMNRMTNILFNHKGTLDKYIGDAIVGYWGAPLELERHAYHGIKAAVEMIETLPEVNEEFKKQGFPEFKVGCGLNTGECSVGNMGSDQIFSYTALGDNMNLGARLEGLCKPYGAQIIISEYTLARLTEEEKSEFIFRDLDLVRVKGKEKPVRIHEVLHRFHHMKKDPYALEVYNESYEAFLKMQFEKAKDLLEPICEKYPEDKASKRILNASFTFIENPPPTDWDGVTTMTTK